MSTTKHILITADYIKQATALDFNVEPSLLKDSILWAQMNYGESLIGSGLFNEIILQHSGNTLTIDNALLLNDYLAPALAFYSLYEASDFVAIRFKNTGIVKLKTDDSEPLSDTGLNSLKNKLKNRAEGWGQRTINYLLANLDKYPLYQNPGNSLDTIRPASNAYSSSIYLYKNKGSGSQNRTPEDTTNNEITLS